MATTPLMSLSLPSVSSTQGPAWASQLNAALAVIDGHTHVAGSGARVPSAGLNINAALAFNGFDAATVRSLRLVNQSAPLALGTDVGCVYESGGNLYYNSAAGQQVQLTSGAALNATSLGGWGGDFATSSASAFYTSAATTFTLWSAANKYASLDLGNIVLREPGATSPNGVTLKSPGSLAASYALTLPAALPAATKILTVSSAGVVAAAYDVDGATLEVAANVLRVKAGGIGTSQLAAPVWTAITAGMMSANWTANAGAAVAIDALGWVHFRGTVSAGVGAANPAITVPSGFLPASGNGRGFALFTSAGVAAVASVNGSTSGMYIDSPPVNGRVYYLDAITYQALA